MKGNFSRGNPDGPTLDGKELVDVHYYVPSKGSGHSDHALCNNGAYNILVMGVLNSRKFNRQVAKWEVQAKAKDDLKHIEKWIQFIDKSGSEGMARIAMRVQFRTQLALLEG